MTEAIAIPTQQPSHNFGATLHYQVAMPNPANHLFSVTLTVEQWNLPTLDLKMPVWTPGSYLIREYSRHVQDFVAQDEAGQGLISNKLSKNHWQVATPETSSITIKYCVFAHDLTVRTNHLDTSHGYFNGAALFFFVPGLEQQPIYLQILPPQSDWIVTTTLPSVNNQPNTFIADDFDTLVDSPVEIGTQQIYEFEVLNKPHQLAIWSHGNAQPDKIIADTQKIITTEAQIFGGLPYQRYLFLLHLSGSGYGGLEHKECCTLNYPRFGFRDPEKYQRFLQLVAHEFFHLWNVKRIRPKALENFDYEVENYTTSLWFSEGTTSYYDILIPLKAGIYDAKTFLKNLSKDITRYLKIEGRKVQPLGESSYDAWIKLYRRDAHSDNNQISYYLKGELVSLLLDLLIRAQHQNQKSLDDVMKIMWQRFGQQEIGFEESQLRAAIAEVAESDLDDFFTSYIDSTTELSFDDYLDPFGLYLKAVKESDAPYLGMTVQSENNREIIKLVSGESPAAVAGIDPNDELLAIDGVRVDSQSLETRLQDYQPGDKIEVTVFHQDQLKTAMVTLTDAQASRYELRMQDNLSAIQQQNLSGWLGDLNL